MRTTYFIILIAGLLGIASCLQPSDSDILTSNPLPPVGKDIHEMLALQQDLALFNQAYKRLGIDKEMDHNKGYTIFAVKDAGMIAAGLTADVINTLAPDSLAKLIRYHILSGTIDDNSLTNSAFTLITTTLRKDTVPRDSHSDQLVMPVLYVSARGTLYLNDYAVGHIPSSIKAANGCIYPVDNLVQPPPGPRSVWDLIKDDPELSMYRFALFLTDSLIRDPLDYWGYYNPTTCSDTLYLQTIPQIFNNIYLPMPTVLAPTNAAFAAAGLHSEEDIRNFALSSPLEATVDEYYILYITRWSPLDSVLKRHMLAAGEINTSFTQPRTPMLYNDLASPNFNNSIFNIYGRDPIGYGTALIKFEPKLQFSSASGGVQVRWSRDPSQVANVIRQPGNKGIASNGAMYKTDHLFLQPR